MKLVNTHTYLLAILFLLFAFYPHKVKAQVWTLQQCIDTAQVINKSLQINRNTMASSIVKQKEAKANLVPKLMINADYKYFTDLPYQLMPLSVFGGPDGQFKEAQFGVPHNVSANLQLVVPLYNSQAYGAIQSTKIATEVANLNYQKSEEQVFFEITNIYYNAQLIHSQRAFIDSNLLNAEKLLNNIELLHDQLLAKGTDVSKVKLQVAQLISQRQNVQSKYDQLMNALKFSIGIPMDQEVTIDPQINFKNKHNYSLFTPIDLRMATAQRSLLTNDFNTLKNSRLPSLNLIGSYGMSGLGYDEKPNDFFNIYPIGFAGIQLSYTLFNGGETYHRIKQKKIELQNNNLQIELLTDKNNLQIENARLQRSVAHRAIDTSSEQVKLAIEIYNQMVAQKGQGVASLTDVLLADNAVREAQQNYINTIVDYLKADLELKKLTGNISVNN